MRKILQVKKGEYMLGLQNNALMTTYKIEDAMDISNWDLKQIGFVVGNLKKVGYTKCQILTVAGEDEQEEGQTDEQTEV